MSISGPLRLSVAAPAYNEAAGIEAVLTNWHDFLSAQPLDSFEIVICDDGSTDGTGDILDRLSQSWPQLRVLHFAKNQGAAAALNAAIAATQGDWVLLTDSDGQFAIENLPDMVEALRRSGAKAAIGIRRKKDAAFAQFGSWASGLVCNLLHGSRMRDFNSAFKLVWGPTLRGLGLEARGMNYSTEVTSRLLERGIVPVEVTIQHRPRAAGASHMKLLRGALHRFLFVCYIALRQLLLRLGVLSRPGS
ncbi:MAG TPA: glycosyltransferase family 2 protein [Rhizomicrobium sp.]|jgi:glycosyltransferase involved in cell wall biosynthesis|nr:glycosyltransferase family 2 protein [Rhizomicrobium sp.]